MYTWAYLQEEETEHSFIGSEFTEEEDPQKTYRHIIILLRKVTNEEKTKWSESKRQSEACCLREKKGKGRRNKGKREGQTKWGQKKERGRR